MANNPNAAKNLIPCKPGEIRNPTGYPKDQPHLKTVIRKILDGKMTVEEGGKKVKKTVEEIQWAIMIQDTINKMNTPADRVRALTLVSDRLYGKAALPIEGGINPIIQINIDSDEAQF